MKTLLLLPALFLVTSAFAQQSNISTGIEGGPALVCMRNGNSSLSSFNVGF